MDVDVDDDDDDDCYETKTNRKYSGRILYAQRQFIQHLYVIVIYVYKGILEIFI